MQRVMLLLSAGIHLLLLVWATAAVRPTPVAETPPQALSVELLTQVQQNQQAPQVKPSSSASATQPVLPQKPSSPPTAKPPVATPAPSEPVLQKTVPAPSTAVSAQSDPNSAAPSTATVPAATPPVPAPPQWPSPATAAASPTNAGPQPVRQGVSIDAAYAAANPQPPYPPIARRLGEQGTVVLRILVAADGTAREVQIKKSSGSPTLDRSAETTIKQWRFIPAKIDGKPVDEWYETRWTFKLEG